MFLNSSNNNTSEVINSVLGNPINTDELSNSTTINSKKMLIDTLSDELNSILEIEERKSYFGMIELRKLGILVTITGHLKTFEWIVLYHELTISNNQFLSINGAKNNFVKFKNPGSVNDNNDFLKTLSILKIKNNLNYSEN